MNDAKGYIIAILITIINGVGVSDSSYRQLVWLYGVYGLFGYMSLWDFLGYDYMGSRWQLTISSPSSSPSSRELGYLILLAGSWYADRRTPQLSKHYSPTTALLFKHVEHYSFTLHPTQLPTHYSFTIQAGSTTVLLYPQLLADYCFTIKASPSRSHYCSPLVVPN